MLKKIIKCVTIFIVALSCSNIVHAKNVGDQTISELKKYDFFEPLSNYAETIDPDLVYFLLRGYVAEHLITKRLYNAKDQDYCRAQSGLIFCHTAIQNIEFLKVLRTLGVKTYLSKASALDIMSPTLKIMQEKKAYFCDKSSKNYDKHHCHTIEHDMTVLIESTESIRK